MLSSDLPRTMQTAYSVMSGFYAPAQILTNGNETIEDYFTNNNEVEIGLPWKSVPIHTIPVEYDNVSCRSRISLKYVHINFENNFFQTP